MSFAVSPLSDRARCGTSWELRPRQHLAGGQQWEEHPKTSPISCINGGGGWGASCRPQPLSLPPQGSQAFSKLSQFGTAACFTGLTSTAKRSELRPLLPGGQGVQEPFVSGHGRRSPWGVPGEDPINGGVGCPRIEAARGAGQSPQRCTERCPRASTRGREDAGKGLDQR